MVRAAVKTSTKKRTAPPEQRRLQLIKATIRSIARYGLSDTTMATVAGEARLSQGIINLHFQSKDRLLAETLRHVADEYLNTWERALERAGPASADKLAALAVMEFEKPLCDRNKLAVWFAFWGESKSRPTYRKICTDRDRQYTAVLNRLCQDLIDDGGYDRLDAEVVATGLSAMSEGLWLDLLLSPKSFSPETARRVTLGYLASYFPRHYQQPVCEVQP
jgi:TetR/AcrR family transcriptional repressor of bet genes